MSGKILRVSFLWLILAATAHAADPAFAVGDKVQVEVSPYKYEGVITEIRPGGLYSVKYKVYGKEVNRNFLEKRITLLGKPKGEGKPKDEEKPEEDKPKKEEHPEPEKPKQEKQPIRKETKGTNSKPAMNREKPADSSGQESKKGKQDSVLDEYHLWQDKLGKSTVVAKFLELDPQKKMLRVETDDNQEVSIPLSRLTEECQELASILSSLKGGEGQLSPVGLPEKDTKTGFKGETGIDLDWSRARRLSPSKLDNLLYRPTSDKPAPPIAKPGKYLLDSNVGKRNAPLLKSFDVERLFCSRGEGTSQRLFAASYSFTPRVQEIDLKSGKALPPLTLPKGVSVFDVSPDGELFLATGTWNERANQILLLKSSGELLKVERTYLLNHPVPEGESPPLFGVKFHSGRFIDEHHIQVEYPSERGSENHSILIDIEMGNVIYDLKYDNWIKSCVSHTADLKTFCTAVGEQVFLLDSLTGETLGWIPDHGRTVGQPAHLSWPLMTAFSPAGTQLAIWRDNNLQIWDLVDNHELGFYEITENSMPVDSLNWIDEDYLLFNNITLYHKQVGAPLWNYFTNPAGGLYESEVGPYFGGLLWFDMFSPDGKEHGLFCTTIPDPPAIEATPAPEPSHVLELKPGTEVAVKIESYLLKEDEQQKVRSYITENLKPLGLKIVEDAPLILKAEITKGDSKQVQFVIRKFGASSFDKSAEKTETATVTEIVSKLSLIVDGRVKWSDLAYGGAPPVLAQIREGESVQSIIDRESKPYLEFYKTVSIPTSFVRNPASFRSILGKSQLTPQGVVRVEMTPAPPTPAKNVPQTLPLGTQLRRER